MKIDRPWTFWSQSPTAAAKSLERWCWLAAAGLVLSLALGVGPAAGAPSRPSAGAHPEDPHVLILQRRCIDHVMWQTAGQSSDAVLEEINRRCLAPLRGKASTAGLRLLSCERPFPVPLTPMTKRVAGCLGG